MIYIITDHAGVELKNELIRWMVKGEREFVDLTPEVITADDYPDRANELAAALKSDPKGQGIAICGTGIGITMALNRERHVRAATSPKREIIRLARQHNNINVIGLAGRFTTYKKAIALVKVFFNTPFLSKEKRHQDRLAKIS
jgi:ribose 5-phosphate isomerase B